MAKYPPPQSYLIPYNSSYMCVEDLERDSCYLNNAQLGEYDAIAAVRMVVSCLSIMGAISIVTWAILKKQVWSPKVHPIFVLSLADTILGLFFLIGGTLWLRRAPSRVGCFAVSLPTVILECVTVNLTVVYALLAYAGIKRKNINNLLTSDKDRVWSPLKNSLAYLIAWITPIVMVMMLFGVVDSQTSLVSKANVCSCYCLPVLGNVIPHVKPRDEGSAMYNRAASSLVLTYGIILVTHYLVCFVLLVVIYYKLLKHIKTIREVYENSRTDPYNYGATNNLLIQGQSKARKRVIYFITVFVINGLCNFVLSVFLVIAESVWLGNAPRVYDDPYFRTREENGFDKFTIILLIMQSLTVPFQGFLNALVYGWTRDDFLTVMAYTNNQDESYQKMENTKKDTENLELEQSGDFEGTAFTDEQMSVVKRMRNSLQNFRRHKSHTLNSEKMSVEDQLQDSLIPSESMFTDSEQDEKS